MAPPFQGPEETTVEIFFDMSHSDPYGEAQGPWRDFRPGLEGAMYWKLPDIPDTDRLEAVRVSKGVFRHYVPKDDYALGGQILWGGIKSQ